MKKISWLSILVGVLFAGIFSVAGTAVINSAGLFLGSFAKLQCGYGLNCAQVSGNVKMKPALDSVVTFASGDQTPAVNGGSYFKSFLNNTVTITDFDDGYTGQEITIMAQGAVTLDVTSSGIIGGTTDIVMVSGDMTKAVYDGTDWRITSYIDQADNLN